MTFTGMPLPDRIFVAAKPSGVQGILIDIFGSLDFRSIPSSIISFAVRRDLRTNRSGTNFSYLSDCIFEVSPDFLIKDGFVVTHREHPTSNTFNFFDYCRIQD